MLDFYDSGVVQISLWVLGVIILGVALVYGVVRAGHLRGQDRKITENATRRRQASEDPQKRSL